MKFLPFFLLAVGCILLALGCLRLASLRRHNRSRKRRRKQPRRTDPMTRLMVVLGAAALLAAVVCCLPAPPDGTDMPTAPTGETAGTAAPTESVFGWQDDGGIRRYRLQDGSYATGWQDLDGKRYYFHEDGTMRMGWLTLDGVSYYLRPDGSMARGQVEIDGIRYFFTSGGANLPVVNPWNQVPEDYVPDLVSLGTDIAVEGCRVDRSCYEDLVQMIADCNAACPRAYVLSAYRSYDHQTQIYQRKVNSYLSQGFSRAEAEQKAATVVAVPGTSEHHLGLAVDIIDTRLWALEEEQEDLPAQRWLMENSWRYGFIFRYPKEKTEITGIIYEPWHYRHVGRALAQEIYESGLTLEEYLAQLN